MPSKLKSIIKGEKAILFGGIALRIIYFIINLFIGGSHIDEVMTALNAGNLANSMTDLNGERLPVYFDTWLYGGQSPFATYLSALSVKLFGFNLFGIRIFALLLSIAGFIAFCGFVNEVFGKTPYSAPMKVFAAISPWMIFSGAFVLDCNYIGHILIIALYFLAKAVNGRGIENYVLSMIFFGLSFYCYMASALFVPFMLICLYLILLIKKKIGFKELVLSVFTITLVATPFILQGLVSLDLLPSFKLLGFSFSKFEYYTRNEAVAFSAENGIFDFITNSVANAIVAFVMMFYINVDFIKVDVNTFQHGTIIIWLFAVIGALYLLFSLIKRKKAFSFVQKLFLVAALTGSACFFLFVNNPEKYVMYRYGQLSYFLIPFAGIGFVKLFKRIKKINLKKALLVISAVSFVLFNAQFVMYANNIPNVFDLTYGDALYECFDSAKDGKINIYCTETWQPSRVSVYARYYYFNSDYAFNSYEDEQVKRINGDYSKAVLTEDNKITINYSQNVTKLSEDFNIIPKDGIDYFEIDDSYTVESHGFWNVVYR